MIDIGIHNVTSIQLGQVLVWNSKSVKLIFQQKKGTAAEITLWALPDADYARLLMSTAVGPETSFQEERGGATYNHYDDCKRAIREYCSRIDYVIQQ